MENLVGSGISRVHLIFNEWHGFTVRIINSTDTLRVRTD